MAWNIRNGVEVDMELVSHREPFLFVYTGSNWRMERDAGENLDVRSERNLKLIQWATRRSKSAPAAHQNRGRPGATMLGIWSVHNLVRNPDIHVKKTLTVVRCDLEEARGYDKHIKCVAALH